jgi:hypothetical protein
VISKINRNAARQPLAGDQSLIAAILDQRQLAMIVATATAGSGQTECGVWRGRSHFRATSLASAAAFHEMADAKEANS